jgi:hypothetical protein
MTTQIKYEIIHSGNTISSLSTDSRAQAFESYATVREAFPKDVVLIQEIINIKNVIAKSDDSRQGVFNFEE